MQKEVGSNRLGHTYHLFYEHEVEELVWEFHGGPARFEA